MEFRTLAEGLEFPEGPVALADGRCCWSRLPPAR